MVKLGGMESVIGVVECGSFTGAASRLGLSGVMVGKFIAHHQQGMADALTTTRASE